MACDTFLKISIKCKRKFVIMQVGEHEPFVDELLRSIGRGVHSFPVLLNLSLLCPFPLNFSSISSYNLTQSMDVSRRCSR